MFALPILYFNYYQTVYQSFYRQQFRFLHHFFMLHALHSHFDGRLGRHHLHQPELFKASLASTGCLRTLESVLLPVRWDDFLLFRCHSQWFPSAHGPGEGPGRGPVHHSFRRPPFQALLHRRRAVLDAQGVPRPAVHSLHIRHGHLLGGGRERVENRQPLARLLHLWGGKQAVSVCPDISGLVSLFPSVLPVFESVFGHWSVETSLQHPQIPSVHDGDGSGDSDEVLRCGDKHLSWPILGVFRNHCDHLFLLLGCGYGLGIGKLEICQFLTAG